MTLDPRPEDRDGIVDPRAVRVSVTGSHVCDHAPLVVSPTDDDGRVLVDGAATRVALRRVDGDRAVLSEAAEDGDGAGSNAMASRPILLRRLAPDAATPPGRQRREVVVDGWRIEVDVEPERHAALRARANRDSSDAADAGPTEVRAIIPGVIVSVGVTEGDDVTVGQQLLVVEAMKMQNELRAPRSGRVVRVAAAAGETVEVGGLLLVIE